MTATIDTGLTKSERTGGAREKAAWMLRSTLGVR
tara:strand:- start:3881 stop:3982 length:102 start_codon:yes stop_codon:yes gene_type:complete